MTRKKGSRAPETCIAEESKIWYHILMPKAKSIIKSAGMAVILILLSIYMQGKEWRAQVSVDRVLFHTDVSKAEGATMLVGKQNFFLCPGTGTFPLLHGSLWQDTQTQFLIYEYKNQKIDPRNAIYPSNGWLSMHTWVGEEYPLMEFTRDRYYYIWTKVPLRMKCGTGLSKDSEAVPTGSYSASSMHAGSSNIQSSAASFVSSANVHSSAVSSENFIIPHLGTNKASTASSLASSTPSFLQSSTPLITPCNAIDVGRSPNTAVTYTNKAYVLHDAGVSIVNLSTGKELLSIPIEYQPTHIVVVGSRVYVGAKERGSSATNTSLTIIDATTDTVLSSEAGPAGPFVTSGRYLYTLPGRFIQSTLRKIDTQSNLTANQWPDIDGESVLRLSGNLLMIHGHYAIDIIDTSSNAVTVHINTNNYRNPVDIVAIGSKVFAAGWQHQIINGTQVITGIIDVIDLTNGTLIKTIKTGGKIESIVANTNEIFLTTSISGAQNLKILNPSSLEITEEIAVSVNASDMVLRDSILFVMGLERVVIVNAITHAIQATIHVEQGLNELSNAAQGILISASAINTGHLYLLNPDNYSLKSFCLSEGNASSKAVSSSATIQCPRTAPPSAPEEFLILRDADVAHFAGNQTDLTVYYHSGIYGPSYVQKEGYTNIFGNQMAFATGWDIGHRIVFNTTTISIMPGDRIRLCITEGNCSNYITVRSGPLETASVQSGECPSSWLR